MEETATTSERKPRRNRTFGQKWGLISLPNRIMVVATVVIAFATAVNLLVAGAMWYEMHEGGTDTHTLADAAQKEAGNMANVSDAADKIRKAAQEMVAQDQRIADNAQKALDASNKQSKSALDASIANARLDQRAWVAPIGITNLNFKVGEPITFAVIFENSGKSPALHERNEVMVRSFSRGFNGEFTYSDAPAALGVKSSTIIQPGMTVKNASPAEGLRPTSEQVDALKSGEGVLYIYGRIFYDDVFSIQHQTTFCYLVDPDLQNTEYCERYNEAN
jgi:hypothetical protein